MVVDKMSSIRISGTDTAVGPLYLATLLTMFAAMGIGTGPSYLWFFIPFLIPNLLVLIPGLVRCRVQRGKVYVLDTEGISCEVHGRAEWLLPWSIYGSSKTRSNGWMAHLQGKPVFETQLLDRNRVAIQSLPFYNGRYSLHVNSYDRFFKRLELRSFCHLKPVPQLRVPTLASVFMRITPGFIVLLCSFAMIYMYMRAINSNLLNEAWAVGPSAIITVAGVVTGLSLLIRGCADFAARQNPKRLVTIEMLPNPDYGPRLDDYLECNGPDACPITLRPGHLYRYIDPNAQHHRKSLRSYWYLLPPGAVAWVMLVIAIAPGLPSPNGFVGFLLGPPAYCGFCGWLVQALTKKHCGFFSTFKITDQDLIEILPDGSHRQFRLPKFDKKRAISRKQSEGFTEYFRNGKKRLHLDRTMLYELDDRIDRPEFTGPSN